MDSVYADVGSRSDRATVGTGTLLRLVVGVALLLGNGYFVTIEFAMTRVRQFKAAAFTGSRGLERA
jgi:CBS domain containing-hemolysin-like protein